MQSTDQASDIPAPTGDEGFSFAFLQDWLSWLPDTTFLNVAAWQWVGLALVIFLGLVGQLLIKTVLGRLLGKLLGGEIEIQRKLISRRPGRRRLCLEPAPAFLVIRGNGSSGL